MVTTRSLYICMNLGLGSFWTLVLIFMYFFILLAGLAVMYDSPSGPLLIQRLIICPWRCDMIKGMFGLNERNKRKISILFFFIFIIICLLIKD